jgi:hypothetical protein
MGVPASEFGYISAKTERETMKSMTDMWWYWIKKITGVDVSNMSIFL